jgi:parallel beta-helix repeat protein
MRIPRLVVVAAALILSVRPASAGTTRLVPQQFPTIQAAVDAAVDGDTILIKGGTYVETVSVSGKSNLTITGKGKVVLDVSTEHPGLTLTNCTECTVQKIGVFGGIPDGILLDGCTGGTLLKCHVDHAFQDGIRLDSCTGVTIDACLVNDSGAVNIALGTFAPTPDNDCVVRKCKLINGQGGVRVNGNGNLVEKNSQKAGAVGFAVDSATVSSNNTFTGNKGSQQGIAGLLVAGAGNTFSNNSLSKCGTDGVSIEGGSNDTVTGTKISKTDNRGIVCLPSLAGMIITHNTISKTFADGIDVQADGALITDNKCSGAGGIGLWIEGSNATCTGNTVKGSKGDGVRLDGTGDTLSGNTAKGSKGFDLDDLGSGNTVDATNKFKTIAP